MMNEAILDLLPNNLEIRHQFWQCITKLWPQINHTTKIIRCEQYDYKYTKVIDEGIQRPVGKWEKRKGLKALFQRQWGGLTKNPILESKGWLYIEGPPPSMKYNAYTETIPLKRVGLNYGDYGRLYLGTSPFLQFSMRCGYHPMTDTFIYSKDSCEYKSV